MKKMLKNFGAVLLAGIMLVSPIMGVTAQAQTGNVTRGQFATMVTEAFGLQPDGAGGFADVDASHPNAAGIAGMQAHGFMLGDSTGNFFPDAYISGAEAAVLLNNMIGFDGSLVTGVNLDIPYWAIPAASVLIDLTMVDADLIQLPRLTAEQAGEFIMAAATAFLIAPGTPYALAQHRVQDNFFGYINRQFLATEGFPPGNIVASAFGVTAELVNQQNEEILFDILNNENLTAGSAEWRARELYHMFLDTDTRRDSIALLQPYFDMVMETTNIEELLELADYLSGYFTLIPYYSVGFMPDSAVDATRWAATISEAGFTLGSTAMYADIPELAHIHEAYINLMATALYHAGETENLQERAAAIFAIEQQRAAVALTPEQNADFIGMFTSAITWEEAFEASSTTGSLSFNEEALDLMMEMNIYSRSLDYIAFINSLYVEENFEVLRDVALMYVLMPMLGVLDDEFTGITDELMSALFGQPVSGFDRTLEERGQSFVTSAMWRTFSRAYYQRFSSQELKDYAAAMAEEIRDMMREMITEIEWMTEETRALSIEKLDAVGAYIAFPDTPVEELDFEVRPIAEGGNLVEFMFSQARLNNEIQIYMLGYPANHFSIWEGVPTSTVNAFYNPMQNLIIMPAGIMQYPFFSLDNTREQNLGGFGAVIAHEFIHAFDPQGSQFDRYGTINSWWMEEDVANFSARIEGVRESLNALEFADAPVNGVLIVNEFVTDLGAMEVIMTLIDRTGGNQALAMEQWARIWASRMSQEVAQLMMMTGVHPPPMMRANLIMSNLDEFYTLFDVTSDDGMYIPAEERISFWR
ncbi:MAG: S-layer homology domain-containing protein [Defluviitaleaceae bacterium]|nr:S-layer homology domain-containing protein [Defluviitaleaceae bacterium]